MLWAPYLLLILIGLFCHNSRPYDYCVIIFMALLAWFNTTAADYALVYLPTYLNPFGVYDMDLGWSWLCFIGAKCGLAYNGFACVMTLISMVLFREFGKRIGANTSFMLALFLIYPGLMSLVQFRQFAASTVGCAAFACLWSSSKGYRYPVFAALMLFAILIHRSSAVLLLALLPSLLGVIGGKGRAILARVALILVPLLLLNWKTLAVKLFGEMRVAAYLGAVGGDNATSLLGGIKNVCLLILMALFVLICCKVILESEKAVDRSLFGWGLNKSLLGILFLNVGLLILAPFAFLNSDFMRFERHGFTMALALFAMMPPLEKHLPSVVKPSPFFNKVIYVVPCIVFAYFYVANSFNSVYTPLLNPETIPAFFAL